MHLKWNFSVSALLAYIPLLATMVTTILSVILARATLRYSKTTEKSLALAREEFEREWSPELHIKLERIPSGDAQIIVTNLAKISVLLQLFQLRKLAFAVPSLRCLLNEPLVGGRTWTDSIQKRLIAATGDEFQGALAVSATFFASGRLFRTDWFRFNVQVKNGEVTRIDPVNMAARRVRVVEPRNGEPAVKRELVRDVTAQFTEETTVEASQY